MINYILIFIILGLTGWIIYDRYFSTSFRDKAIIPIYQYGDGYMMGYWGTRYEDQTLRRQVGKAFLAPIDDRTIPATALNGNEYHILRENTPDFETVSHRTGFLIK